MIWSGVLSFGRFLSKAPWQVWAALAVIVTAWLWGNHRYNQGYDARTAEYAAQALETAHRARKADAAAASAADAGKSAVEAKNQAARDAARNSDDLLSDGLEALR